MEQIIIEVIQSDKVFIPLLIGCALSLGWGVYRSINNEVIEQPSKLINNYGTDGQDKGTQTSESRTGTSLNREVQTLESGIGEFKDNVNLNSDISVVLANSEESKGDSKLSTLYKVAKIKIKKN